MKRIIAIVLLSLLSLTLVAAEGNPLDALEINTTDLSDQEIIDLQKETIKENLDTLKEVFNTGESELPGLVEKIFGNERVAIYLEDGYTFGVVLDDGKIIEFKEGKVSNPGINIYIKNQLFVDSNAGDVDLVRSLGTKDIRIEGVGFLKKIKVGTIISTLKVLSMFN
jgi:hypothetical protein